MTRCSAGLTKHVQGPPKLTPQTQVARYRGRSVPPYRTKLPTTHPSMHKTPAKAAAGQTVASGYFSHCNSKVGIWYGTMYKPRVRTTIIYSLTSHSGNNSNMAGFYLGILVWGGGGGSSGKGVAHREEG